MKKLLTLIFIFSLQAVAQQNVLVAPFLKGSYSGLSFALTPTQNGLVEECKEYAGFLITNAVGLTAEDVEFARSLPQHGQMKSTIEVDFEIQNLQKVAASDAIAELDEASLQELVARRQSDSLSEVSVRLGLLMPEPELHKARRGFVLRVKSRDLMCDMLSSKIHFTAKARISLSRNEDDSAFLNLFYSDISAATGRVLATNDAPFVKAALLGLAYSEIFKKHNLADSETRNNVGFLFETFFKPGSLELSPSNFQQRRNLGLVPIVLKAGIK